MHRISFDPIELNSLPIPNIQRTGWPWTDAPEPLPEALPDGSPWPKISVVTPSFNQGQFIEETIRSVLLQGYPNLEFIIIDGGSTDNTLEIIRKYEPWLTYWVSEPDRGQGHAVNKGIQKATGEILLWLNSDDLVLPGVFSKIARRFTEDKSVGMVIGQARIIDSQGNVTGELRSNFSSWEELATNPRNSARQISTFFSREMFENYGAIDESLFIAMDSELMVRFCQFNRPVIIEDYLTAFRTHKAAKTASHILKGYIETDTNRHKYLVTPKMRRDYRHRSASNWLSLFESICFAPRDRVDCMIRAIKMNPYTLFSHRFWATVRKFLLASK